MGRRVGTCELRSDLGFVDIEVDKTLARAGFPRTANIGPVGSAREPQPADALGAQHLAGRATRGLRDSAEAVTEGSPGGHRRLRPGVAEGSSGYDRLLAEG